MNEPIPNDQDILTTNTGNNGSGQPITVGASDVLMSSLFPGGNGFPTYARQIYAIPSGVSTIGIKRQGDPGFTSYPIPAGVVGQYFGGRIVAVGSTSNGSSAGVQFIAEQ